MHAMQCPMPRCGSSSTDTTHLAVQQLVEGVVQVNIPSTARYHKVTLQDKQPQKNNSTHCTHAYTVLAMNTMHRLSNIAHCSEQQ
jgi:hypothetical protein